MQTHSSEERPPRLKTRLKALPTFLIRSTSNDSNSNSERSLDNQQLDSQKKRTKKVEQNTRRSHQKAMSKPEDAQKKAAIVKPTVPPPPPPTAAAASKPPAPAANAKPPPAASAAPAAQAKPPAAPAPAPAGAPAAAAKPAEEKKDAAKPAAAPPAPAKPPAAPTAAPAPTAVKDAKAPPSVSSAPDKDKKDAPAAAKPADPAAAKSASVAGAPGKDKDKDKDKDKEKDKEKDKDKDKDKEKGKDNSTSSAPSTSSAASAPPSTASAADKDKKADKTPPPTAPTPGPGKDDKEKPKEDDKKSSKDNDKEDTAPKSGPGSESRNVVSDKEGGTKVNTAARDEIMDKKKAAAAAAKPIEIDKTQDSFKEDDKECNKDKKDVVEIGPPAAATPAKGEDNKDAEDKEEKKEKLEGDSESAAVITEAQIKQLQALEYYHGFIPREDVQVLLGRDGDFILRVSEVENKPEEGPGAHWELILSVCIDSGQKKAKDKKKANKMLVKNVIIQRKPGWYIEAKTQFTSLPELIEHYRKNKGVVNRLVFFLKTPIKMQEWELRHREIEIGKFLGKGAFGEVRQGTYTAEGKEGVQVAIKLMKGGGDLCKAKVKEMMKEARLMRYFKHENVVRIFGVSVDEQPIMILMEFIEGGSLDVYLKKNVGKTEGDKLRFCFEGARGITYLHKHNCIHRDLAARNCLISKDKIIKISDFGLSKLAEKYKMKKSGKLPIKWLAPEILKTFTFTQKTDVYSYGVMCYEIYMDGSEPWEKWNNAEVRKMLAQGRSVQLPHWAPDEFREYTKNKILVHQPEKRVSMAEILIFLDSLISSRYN